MALEFTDKYIDLILKSCIDLKKGENILIAAEPHHWPFLRQFVKRAYELGAKYVEVEANDPYLTLARANYSDEEFLSYQPNFKAEKFKNISEEKWNFIKIDGPQEPDLLKEMDQAKHKISFETQIKISEPFRTAMMNGSCAWVICPLPTPNWGKKVLPASKDPERELWKELVPILRLDKDDPVGTWKDLSKILHSRATTLNEMNLKKIHVTGPGTDLKVELPLGYQFRAGQKNTKTGKSILVNMPTEEVFCSPDYRRTEGRVQITRPVNVLGFSVEDAWFEFKEGRVVDFGAKTGKEAIEQFLSYDDGAKCLGEFALVDCNSPIYKSGKVFDSILLDENAACHFALGFSFPYCLKDSDDMTKDQLKEKGLNQSKVHLDFMFGSDKINIIGITDAGKEIAIIKNGHFQLG